MISIIVPVYNAEKYIERCIKSIMSQTYSEWELIIINDGSSDKSPLICEKFAIADKRIHVIHSANEGVSSARNKGLDVVKGDWVTFVDADDWIEDNHLQCFVSQATSSVDLCVNSFIADMRYGARSFHYPELIVSGNYESVEIFFTVLKIHSQFLWNKMFRRSCIVENNIRFNTTLNLGEDNVFILEYLNHIKGISSSPICTYHYDQKDENPMSLGRRKRSEEDLSFQLKMNYEAIMKLYKTYNNQRIFNYASDYYYTRVFQRLIVPCIVCNKGLVKPVLQSVRYIENIKALDFSKIKDRTIRKYWNSVECGKEKSALLALYIYILNRWFKSNLFSSGVVVRRVFRNALHNV